MKARLPWILAIALIVSAMGLINSQYRAHKIFAKVELAQTESRQLELEYGQLQLKQSSLSQHAAIEQKAMGSLNMVRISKSNTEFMKTE